MLKACRCTSCSDTFLDTAPCQARQVHVCERAGAGSTARPKSARGRGASSSGPQAAPDLQGTAKAGKVGAHMLPIACNTLVQWSRVNKQALMALLKLDAPR